MPPAPTPTPPGWGAHLRAALVALHLLAVTLAALPAPEGAADRAAWRDPTVRAELDAWAARLTAWGRPTTPEELEDRLYPFVVRALEVRGAALRPFMAYYHYCGTWQSWRMFVAPHTHPTALHVDVREGGEWRPVYVERDPAHAWRGRQLDSYRFRSVLFRFGWPSGQGDYRRFARWLAAQAARDFPEAEALRVRLYRRRTPTPAEVRAGAEPAGAFEQEVVLPLEEFR